MATVTDHRPPTDTMPAERPPADRVDAVQATLDQQVDVAMRRLGALEHYLDMWAEWQARQGVELPAELVRGMAGNDDG